MEIHTSFFHEEFPICEGTYTNEYNVSDVDFLGRVSQFFDMYIHFNTPFYASMCYSCREPGSLQVALQRCGGCQLVAYCNKTCQKNTWVTHKYVCKEFPVINGKNVLHTSGDTTGSWKKHIAGLRERLVRIHDPYYGIVVGNAARILRNPRVCHTCRNACPEKLFECKKCLCISYCSKLCVKADKLHKEHCNDLLNLMKSDAASTKNLGHLASQRTESICEKFEPIGSNWNNIISSNEFDSFDDGKSMQDFIINCLAYPMSLMYALQMLPERRLGSKHCPLEDLTTLDIHVINSSPFFDSEPWEFFMHRLPKLRQLKVVYVMQGKSFKQSINLNTMTNRSLLRCDDCKVKNRIITYSVQQKHYHMYFSSQEYTEPDVVVIFGNNYEMSESKEIAIHSELSYRNMIDSQDTILVLMDSTKELVKQGVRAVNVAHPVNQLVRPQENPFRGCGSDRSDIDSNTSVINDRHYFTCLKCK